jgi:hypothetical protein
LRAEQGSESSESFVGRKAEEKLENRKNVYLLLCVIGIVLPTRNSSLGPENGLHLGLIFRQLSRIASGFFGLMYWFRPWSLLILSHGRALLGVRALVAHPDR